ncbi:MAG: DUF87 domain-containing protein [Thermoplasmata archaeon]|nr:DUF87 domain-containing protein [Thermoplasmata archaeon]
MSDPPAHEAEGHVVRGGRCDAPLLVRKLPREVPFGFLSRLLPTSRSLELRMQWHPIPRERAIGTVRSARAVAETELEAGGSEEVAELELEAESAHDLERRLASNEQRLFRVGLSLHAVAPNRGAVERDRTDLVRRLSALGFVPGIPRYQAAAATAPPSLDGGESRPAGYWHTLPTDAVAAFFPFVDEAVLEPGGVLIGLLLDDAAPVVLDRWRHASYSWGVFGATGSGKSFAAALLALRTRWMTPGLEVYVLDPLGEFDGLAEPLGATAVGLGPSAPARFHPLDVPAAGGDPRERASRVVVALRALYPSLADEEAATLDAAVVRLLEGTERPTFARLAALIASESHPGRLPALLDVFVAGSLRYLDRPVATPPPTGSLVLGLHDVAPEHRAFQLTVVLDALYARIRQTDGPKLLIVDEAHLLAKDPATAEFLDRLVRHVRHHRTGVILLSQNPDDFLGTEGGRSLLRNLRATLLLHLPEVSEAARRFFSLTDSEAGWLPKCRLPKEAGYAEGLLRFGPSHLPLAVVASTPEYELLTRALRRTASPSDDADGTARL